MKHIVSNQGITYVSEVEHVYMYGYTTSGKYFWVGVLSGYHEIDLADLKGGAE